MTDDHDPQDQAWRDALRPLHSVEPPGALEARVLAGVTRKPTTFSRLKWLAAAVLLVVLGGVSQRFLAKSRTAEGGPRFLLLLFEGPAFDSTSASHQARVDEYRAWAGSLAKAGELVEAGELAPAEQRLGVLPGSTAGEGHVVAGFFIVRARDAAAARAIAETCPHLAHGGGVVVRPLTGS